MPLVSLRTAPRALVTALLLLRLTACSGGDESHGTKPPGTKPRPAEELGSGGLGELDGALAMVPPATCVWVATSGSYTITQTGASVPVLLISLDENDDVLVNGEHCSNDTSQSPPYPNVSSLVTLTVLGSSGSETVALDYGLGQFAAGTNGTTPRTIVDLKGGTDKLRIRTYAPGDPAGMAKATCGPTAGAGTTAYSLCNVNAGVGTGFDAFPDVKILATEEVYFYLGAGNDTFKGTGGDGTGTGISALQLRVYGYAGNDTITTGTGHDLIVGGDDDDVLSGGTGTDTIQGGNGNDSLYGGAGSDSIDGEVGDDWIDGESVAGSDILRGGADIDTVDYSGRSAALTLNPGCTTCGASSENDTIGSDVENFIGGSGSDHLTGDANDNILRGGAGNDTLIGGLGDDTIDGGPGNDFLDEDDASHGITGNDMLDGGAGTDTVSYAGRTTGGVTVTVALDMTEDADVASNNNDGQTGEFDHVYSTIEAVIGTSQADSITASNAGMFIRGGLGNDTLTGGSGNDTFDEGAVTSGADVISCAAGSGDIVDYSARTIALAVLGGDSTANDGQDTNGDGTAADDEADKITGCERIKGGSGNDLLDFATGTPASYGVTLDGNAGTDTLRGGDAGDILDGGPGIDDLACGAGADTAYGSPGPDLVNVDCELQL